MPDIKVLVVDDSPTMRRIVCNSLKHIGFPTSEEATDGRDALAKLGGDEFGAIITDWNMPVMSGLEFIQAVKKDDRFANIPILMVTTRSLENDVVIALKAGASNYIVKPFTPQTLKEKIEKILLS